MDTFCNWNTLNHCILKYDIKNHPFYVYGKLKIKKTTCQHSKIHIHFLLGQLAQEVLRRCWQWPRLSISDMRLTLKIASISDVAKRTGKDPRTIKKYVDMEDFNEQPKKVQTRLSPVFDPVRSILDEWIKEDLSKKKKFHRTAKRMWELLKELHGFKGADRTVRDYVSQKKKELLNEVDKAALPLESIPGTAQVDFGEAPFITQNA